MVKGILIMDSTRRAFLQTPALLGTAKSSAGVSAEVKNWNNKPTLFLNGKPQYAAFYALTDCPGGRWSWEEGPRQSIRQFAQMGFQLFQVDLFLELLCPKAGALDLGLARRQLRGVLEVCPEAAIVLRWHLNAPPWWAAEHRSELVSYANAPLERIEHNAPVRLIHDDLRRSERVSLASVPWKKFATERTAELLRGLAAVPEGKALAGVQVCCGVYGEWHNWGFMQNEPDTGPAMQAEFDRYRQRLGKPPAAVPQMAERSALDDGIFRDPALRGETMDYYRCQQELVADLILHFCRTVKRNWPRKILTGAFYGYFFSMFNRQVTGGHLCLPRVLESPDIDYLSAPQAYGSLYRDLGGCGITRSLVESIRQHGKLFLDEMDQSPSWKWQNNVDVAFVLSDLEADRAVLRRNVLESYTRGMGFWYYDFGPANHTGWWNDQRLMAEIGQLKVLLERYHQKPYQPVADVLFVYDTEVYYYTGSTPGADKLTDPQAVNQATGAAWASGAAIATIHLADLEKMDLTAFRVIVFANTWVLTAAQRRFIEGKLLPSGKQLIFQGPVGYCDGQRLDGTWLRELPGGVKFAEPIVNPSQWRKLFAEAGAHVYVEGDRVVHAGGGVVLVHGKDRLEGELRLRSGRSIRVQYPAKSSLIFDAESGEQLL